MRQHRLSVGFIPTEATSLRTKRCFRRDELGGERTDRLCDHVEVAPSCGLHRGGLKWNAQNERGSDKEFVRFLRISLGSVAELRTQLYLAEKLVKIDSRTSRQFSVISFTAICYL